MSRKRSRYFANLAIFRQNSFHIPARCITPKKTYLYELNDLNSLSLPLTFCGNPIADLSAKSWFIHQIWFLNSIRE
jgi:hypothetical protein